MIFMTEVNRKQIKHDTNLVSRSQSVRECRNVTVDIWIHDYHDTLRTVAKSRNDILIDLLCSNIGDGGFRFPQVLMAMYELQVSNGELAFPKRK